MKKLLALFLALTLVFSMSGAVFAENETESTVSEQTDDAMETIEPGQSTAAVDSTVLNLTGDAVDEVVNLKDGQSVTTDNDVAVRLNVQEDPEEVEYTVTMDGEPVEEDHSTSQYHFYYLPSEQMNEAETNVSVSTQALDQGDGTEANPYKIATVEDLKAFRDKVNGGSTSACAVLTADITLDKSESWTPIGTSSKKYAGTFDGGGHTISGLNVNETGSNEAGLFGDTAQNNTSPVIKNLTIADSSFVTASGYAGAVAGYGGGVYENCHTNEDVTVQGKKYAGGIIGNFKGSGITAELSMKQCSNRATVKEVGGFGGYAGGLIGQAEHPLKLEASFNVGEISSKPSSQIPHAGGLVGATSYAATFSNVYNVGNVTVSGGSNVAGFVGNSLKELTITNAYQHGSVTAGSADGAAVVGVAAGAVTLKNVYKTGSLVDKLNGAGAVTGSASAKTEEELKTLAPTLGGEFASDLTGNAAVNNGFPVLKWQNPTAAAADTLQVKVKNESGTVVLDNEGSADPSNPTEKIVSFDSSALNIYTADRIYLNVGTDNTGAVELGMELSTDGRLNKKLTEKTDGYTADELYFYRLPDAVGRTVYAVHTQDGTARYYKLQIQRKADESMSRYGALSADWRDDNPVLNTTYDESTGYLTATVNVSDNFAFYNKGVLDKNQKAQALFTYDTPFKWYGYNVSDKAEDGTQTIQFARVGRWWAANKSDTQSRSSIPIAAWWGSKDVADKYLAAAAALKTKDGYNNLPEDLRTEFDSAVKAVSDGWTEDTAKPLYLDASENYTTTVTDFVARDAFGAPMTGEYRLEYQENLMLNYMDIIKTYLTNSDLGSWKYQALKNLTAGIDAQKDKLKVVTAMAVTDDDTKNAYEYYYQRTWRIVNASDITEINSALTELGLDRVKIEVVSETAQVLVGNKSYDVDLTEGGTSSSSAKTVTVTAERGDGGMQRIYFAPTENTTFTDSSMEAVAGKGYTKNDLFFYDTPVAQSKSFTIAVKQDGTNHYYTIQVQIPAKSGLALGTNGMGYEEKLPGSVTDYDGNTGYAYADVGFDFDSYPYAAMSLYKDGVKQANSSIAPAWSSLASETQKLYYQSQPQAFFARFGAYWLPVSTTEDGTKVDGLLPMIVKCTTTNTEETIYSKADVVKDTGAASEEAKKMLTDAMQKVYDCRNHLTDQLYLKSDGSNPDNLDKATGIQARSYFGAYLYGDSLIEKDLNTVLDLTDIFTTWGTSADLAAQQFEAYQKVMNMDGGVHAAIEIQSVADRDLYQKIRQAKWNIVKATDLDGINAALTSLGLSTIGDDEPEVKLGDINCDGKIELSDAVLLIKYCNGQATLTKDQLANADLNGDSKIELADAVMLVKYCNGVISEFPANSK